MRWKAGEEELSMRVEDIAQVCHEANRAYCKTLGDDSQPAWYHAPDWQFESAIAGVRGQLDEHAKTGQWIEPRHAHVMWLAHKRAEGWTYGVVKDPAKKQHPCFVPYDDLPEDQKRKDVLFGAIVQALAG